MTKTSIPAVSPAVDMSLDAQLDRANKALREAEEDLIDARNRKWDLGPYLIEKQNATKKTEDLMAAIAKNNPPKPVQIVPDLNQIQFVIGTSSVGRKDSASLARTLPR